MIIVLLKQRFLELYAYGACISKARAVREAVKATGHHVPLACHCNVIVIAINQHLLVANRHGGKQLAVDLTTHTKLVDLEKSTAAILLFWRKQVHILMVESHHHMLASENMLQPASVFRESHVCM